MDPISLDDVQRAARTLGLSVADDVLAALHPMIAGYAANAAAFPVESPTSPRRDGGRAPEPEENPLGAWYWRCSVREREEGPLAGRTVALKDNIALAGIPMMDGNAALRGYVPDADATVAARILAAGGEIMGKAVCENLCLSAGSHTAATGPVRNPRDPSRTSGGSSSGCGALVGSGAVDLAVGGDQGGSIRIPASHCGIVGHKPTHGLVPYTGALGLEPGVDHLGPMARTVADAALLLDVLAGPDGLDPRQCPRPVADHRGALTGGASGLRVGVLAEGFGHDSSDPRVDELVRSQAARLADAGAAVVDISVPAHRQANGVLGAILGHGLLVGMFAGGALGTLGKGWYSASLAERWGESLASADLSPNALVLAVAAQLQLEADHGAVLCASVQRRPGRDRRLRPRLRRGRSARPADDRVRGRTAAAP